ncbi:hypothetical protein KY362_04790 [Candidatus Woesearchaeota archaeon]|nr:hypothetical protein [Candidatus Woesearchaeota archaeon]
MGETLYDLFKDKDLEGLPRLLSDEKVQGNHDRIVDLLLSTGRDGIESLVDWMESSDYFTAPASTQPGYHGAYVGGLAEHSLNVYEEFAHKVERYGLDIKEDEAIIASLLHDLVKVNYYEKNMVKNPAKKRTKGMSKKEYDAIPSKRPQPSKPWKRDLKYDPEKDNVYLGHGETSVYHAMKHIRLTANEAILIRWHMAAFDPAWEHMHNSDTIKDQCPAIIAFHHADNEAGSYVDGKGYD